MLKLNDVSYLAGTESLADALKGRYAFEGLKDMQCTVIKGIGFITTPIASDAIAIDYKLPECYDAYASICNGSRERFVKVTDSHLQANLVAGEQLTLIFKLK